VPEIRQISSLLYAFRCVPFTFCNRNELSRRNTHATASRALVLGLIALCGSMGQASSLHGQEARRAAGGDILKTPAAAPLGNGLFETATVWPAYPKNRPNIAFRPLLRPPTATFWPSPKSGTTASATWAITTW